MEVAIAYCPVCRKFIYKWQDLLDVLTSQGPKSVHLTWKCCRGRVRLLEQPEVEQNWEALWR